MPGCDVFTFIHFKSTRTDYPNLPVKQLEMNVCLTIELNSGGIDLRVDSFDDNYGDGQWNLMKLVNNSAENKGI